MQAIIFQGFEWSNTWFFLSGPCALLLLLWSVLDKNNKRRWGGSIVASGLFLVFALSARPLVYGELKFHSSLSATDVETAYRESLDLSRNTGRPVLYYFHADWCSNCEELIRRLERKDILRRLDSFILVSIDVTEEREYEKARSIFGLNAVPSLAFAESGELLNFILAGVSFPESALTGVLEKLKKTPDPMDRTSRL